MNPSPFSLLHIVVMLLATADPTNGIAKDGPGATGSKASEADERRARTRASLLRYSWASIGTSGTCQRLLAARILHVGSKNTARWQQDFCPLAARIMHWQQDNCVAQFFSQQKSMTEVKS